MITTAMDRSKRENLNQALRTDFPTLTEQDLKGETLENLIATISLTTHQDEKEIAALIEKKLEYICSKSV